MKTTLRKIRKFTHSDFDGKKLLTFLQKTEADDEELSLLTILESNGLHDALWALRFVDGFDKEIRLMACDFAESVVHLANDERSVNAIKVARNYANGLATKEELNAASDAAKDAWSAKAAYLDDCVNRYRINVDFFQDNSHYIVASDLRHSMAASHSFKAASAAVAAAEADARDASIAARGAMPPKNRSAVRAAVQYALNASPPMCSSAAEASVFDARAAEEEKQIEIFKKYVK